MIRLNILGTGHSMATNCFNTCFTIEENNKHFLVDTGGGNGILRQLNCMNIKIKNIKAIFISHSHQDHILGAIWIIRYILPRYFKNEYVDAIKIYGNEEVINTLRKLIDIFIPKDFLFLIDKKVILITIVNNETVEILGKKVTFFDINARKKVQYGFYINIDNDKFTFIGDECCSEKTKTYIFKSKWLLADAYMCGEQAEKYNPIKRHHHSSVKYISKIANDEKIENLILSHTYDDNIDKRKIEFTKDAQKYFNGNIFIPDDLDVIIIK